MILMILGAILVIIGLALAIFSLCGLYEVLCHGGDFIILFGSAFCMAFAILALLAARSLMF